MRGSGFPLRDEMTSGARVDASLFGQEGDVGEQGADRWWWNARKHLELLSATGGGEEMSMRREVDPRECYYTI